MAQGPVVLYVVLLVVCLVLSGIFSGSEAALLSVQRVKLHQMVRRRMPGARLVARLVDDPQRFLPTILLANNLVNTAAAALGTAIALTLIGSEQQAVLAATVGVTVLLLVFGETVPKSVGIRHAETVSTLVATPIIVLGRLVLPLTFVLNWVSHRVLLLFGGVPQRNLLTEEELRVMISVGRETGVVDSVEARLLERVFRFGDRQVREVMTPRVEAAWLEQGTTLDQFLGLYGHRPHSWYPVISGNADNIVGVLSIRDTFTAMANGRVAGSDDVTTLCRAAVFTPETKPVPDLMAELQESGDGMAITVDEFGGVAGIVTLIQLVEEVMGPLHADEVPAGEEFFALNDRTFLVDGGARFDEVNERLGIDLPEGDYETIAGFLLTALGRIPTTGEEYSHGDVHLAVTRMEGMKVERVRITRPAPAPAETEAEAG